MLAIRHVSWPKLSGTLGHSIPFQRPPPLLYLSLGFLLILSHHPPFSRLLRENLRLYKSTFARQAVRPFCFPPKAKEDHCINSDSFLFLSLILSFSSARSCLSIYVERSYFTARRILLLVLPSCAPFIANLFCLSLSLSLSLYYFLPFSLFIHPIYSCAAASATNSDYSRSVSILRQFF